MTEYKFQQLKHKYHDFSMPMANIIVNGKSFGENKHGLMIGELEIELTSGYEASAANYHIYNCVDVKTGNYLAEELKRYILLGSMVQIEMGYNGVMKEVFRGFIAQIQFLCEEGDAPCIEVTVMDIKGIMMANSYAKQMRASYYSAAVREVLNKTPYQNLISQGVLNHLSIADTPDQSNNEKQETAETIEMVSESDYEFVVKAAKRYNYEFFVETDTLYFRKAKKTEGILMELGVEEGILNTRISYDIRGLVQNIEVRGMDTGKGGAVIAKKKFSNKISAGNKAKALISKTEKIYIDFGLHTKEQAQFRADTLMEQMAYRFGELECTCIGMPELLPGKFIELKGYGGIADNQFYIMQVRHLLTSAGGYRTFISGKTAGLKKE